MRPTLVILAGGKGTRLGPLTKEIPKPVVEVHGKPFLYWLIKHYVAQGFTDIVVSTGYKAEVIEEYPWPWMLKFERDSETWGPEDYYLQPDWWVVNGDTWVCRELPEVSQPSILTWCGLDAGAQFTGVGKVKVFESNFYDIGTPYGLERFKEYFKSHPLCKS